MSFVYHERPGVYAEYDVTHIGGSMGGTKVIGLIGVSPTLRGLYTYTSAASAMRHRDNSEFGKMLRTLYANGAGKVLAYAVEADDINMYRPAIEQLLEREQVDYLVLSSAREDVQLLAKQNIVELQAQCLCFAGMDDASGQQMLARAAALNHERMILIGQDVILTGEEDLAGGRFAAAAFAAQLAHQTDPAAPLHGLVLEGLQEVNWNPIDDVLDRMVQGGVTVLECVGGAVSILRSLTTRTTAADGAADATLREVNTMLIVDEVIPHLRTVLRQNFMRSKNNATTRAAILHRMVMELEEYMRLEIIDGYDDLQVTADSADPTVCRVEFAFSVAHGMGRIYLTAHITV